MTRELETRTTKAFAELYREYLIKLYSLACEGEKSSYVSPRLRKRFKTFASDKMLRCIRDVSEDISLLELEKEVFGDKP